MRTPNNPKLLRRSGEENEHADMCLRFRQTRMEMNITQEDFSEMLGITISVCKGIERGYFSPTIKIIKLWNRRFNKSLDWIFYGK